MNSTTWNVYLNNRKIDTVFFTADFDKEAVRNSLIRDDGYDGRIKVCKSKKSYK